MHTDEHGKFFYKLERLVEETYDLNGNKTVVLVGHSQGCTMLLYFLNQLTHTWKDKYIKSFVTIAGPFTGSVDAVLTYISGKHFYIL